MLIQTTQSKKVYNKLMTNGIHYVNSKKYIEHESYLSDYQFIIDEMNKRKIENPYNAELPIWAYTKNHYDIEEDNNEVTIVLEVPNEIILESNHTYYENYVLCSVPLLKNEKEEEKYKEFIDDYGCYKFNNSFLETWMNIFKKDNFGPEWDFSFIKHPDICTWQGTLWYIKKEWIVRFTEKGE